jgi:hypothetical protein
LTVVTTPPTAEVAGPAAPWSVFLTVVGVGPVWVHPVVQVRGVGVGPVWWPVLVPGSRETGKVVWSERRLAWLRLRWLAGVRPPAARAPAREGAGVVADSARDARVAAGALTRGTETRTGED